LRILDLGIRNKKFSLTLLLILSLAGSAPAAQDQQIEKKLAGLAKISGKLTFVVLGDNRSGDDIYRKLVSMVMERKPDFIVNTGDMVASPGDLKEWTKFWELSRPITVPYFLTVGNHDVHPKVPLSEKTYKEQVDLPSNELNYAFAAGNSLFVVLDTYLDDSEKKVIGEQFTWLESLLARSDAKHKFVFLHHPLYPDKNKGKHHGNSLDRYPFERDRLQALFVKYNVTAVFAGHEHLYLRKTIEGIPHVITGGGGAPLYTDELNGGFYHYIHMTVDGDKVSGEVVDIKRQVRDRF
jgi:3',5'-cyclic AMP phosphodiesterase CpdA